MKMKYVFWFAASLVGYSYLGYPIWLWLRSRWSPRPVRRSSATPAVSVVMVVRNEEAVIARKLENLLTLDYPQDKLEVVVVSDGSSDRTPEILAEYAGNSRVRTLLKSASQGKAAGLNDAMKVATGEILLFTDARQQIEPGALGLLMWALPVANSCLAIPSRERLQKAWASTGVSKRRFANWSPLPAP
jgi:cellulose synthase/poly-beta-1,6-N-acetylglucosamine synthase-like glycosyltransferase